MARYRITTPDGKRTFEVEGPDDATSDELQAFARQQAGVSENYPVADGGKVAPDVDPETALIRDVGEGVKELGLGVLEGGANVLDHAADWVQSGLNSAGNALGAGNVGDSLNSAWGGGKNDLSAAVPKGVEGYDTIRGIGKIAGEGVGLASLAPLGGGALVQGGIGGAILSDKKDTLGVLMDAGVGAVAGRATEAVFNGARGVVRPQLEDRVQRLLGEGVDLTTGQLAGQRNAVKRLEDIGATVPLVQGPVAEAQRRATVSLNRAATNRALTPIGERLPANVEVGHDTVAYAGDRLRQAYGDVLPRLSGNLDQQFSTRINTIRTRAQLPAAYDQQIQQVTDELGNAFTRAGPNGQFSGRTLRDASERLEDLSSAWRRSDDPYLRRIGDVAQQYREQLHALARRQNPRDAARLRDIDRGYASLVRVEKAAAGTADGVFTPRQYDSAVRNSDRSVRRRMSGRGQALDQQLSSDAASVMPNMAAQGGSKDVNSLIALGAIGTGVMGMQPAAIAAGAGIIGGRQLYRPGAQDAIRAFMARNPGPARDALGRLLEAGSAASPYAAPALIEQSR
jgi:hypothetical protein